MKVFVLTCINEVKELLSAEVFDTIEKAQNKMRDEYQDELDAMIFDYGEDEMQEFSIGERNARVVYECNTDAYWWDIVETELK